MNRFTHAESRYPVVFPGVKPAVALVVDVVAIMVFAILGRSSHAEQNTLLGVLGTAWPFLIAAAIGHLICRVVGSLRTDPTQWRYGLLVWATTLVLGMLLRVAAGATAAWPFILVATLVLAAFLLGWRAIIRLVHRARQRANAPI